MSNPRVLCLGEILFDLLADQLGRSLSEVESWTPYPGGAPANVACALVKLGTSSGFIGCVGKDEPGDKLVQLLQEVGVDSTGVQRHLTVPTRQVYVVRSAEGDRTFAGFGNYDTAEFADTRLQANQLPVQLFEAADFLVLGTLELAYPDSAESVFRALDLAEQYDVKIVLDVNWRPVFWSNPDTARQTIQNLFKRIDFLKLSDEEAEWLFNTTDPGADYLSTIFCRGSVSNSWAKGCAYCLGENEGRYLVFQLKW
jgi:fructokinase